MDLNIQKGKEDKRISRFWSREARNPKRIKSHTSLNMFDLQMGAFVLSILHVFSVGVFLPLRGAQSASYDLLIHHRGELKHLLHVQPPTKLLSPPAAC